MEEIWKDIKNYEGSYQCSNLGRIRSLNRYVYEKTGKRQFRKGQEIKTRLNNNGYLQFALNKNGIRKMKYVHIIVAETFLPNPLFLETVNHKDGNKLNNKVSNLEWSSQSDNNLHAYEQLDRKTVKIGGRPKSVYIKDVEKNIIYSFNSIGETSRTINLSHTQINRYIHSNKLWKERYYFTTNSNECVEDIEKVV